MFEEKHMGVCRDCFDYLRLPYDSAMDTFCYFYGEKYGEKLYKSLKERQNELFGNNQIIFDEKIHTSEIIMFTCEFCGKPRTGNMSYVKLNIRK